MRAPSALAVANAALRVALATVPFPLTGRLAAAAAASPGPGPGSYVHILKLLRELGRTATSGGAHVLGWGGK